MPILSSSAQMVVDALSQTWNAFVEDARTNPLWTLVISAFVMAILFTVPLRYAWMYLRLWFWQACCWRDKMLGRYKNFNQRARIAEDLVRLVTFWTINGTIKKTQRDNMLAQLAHAFSIPEILPVKDIRPLHRYKVEALKAEIKNGKRKLAGLPGTEKNPHPKLPGGLPEPANGKRKLRVVSG